jgi:hypothetical protein
MIMHRIPLGECSAFFFARLCCGSKNSNNPSALSRSGSGRYFYREGQDRTDRQHVNGVLENWRKVAAAKNSHNGVKICLFEADDLDVPFAPIDDCHQNILSWI